LLFSHPFCIIEQDLSFVATICTPFGRKGELMKRRWLTLLAAFTLAPIGSALAQTSFINPNGVGGYTIITPGAPTTFVNPNGVGGYTSITPGQGTTFINPNGLGGYNVIKPYQPPPPAGPFGVAPVSPPVPCYGCNQ
jgi:hypothetical protein